MTYLILGLVLFIGIHMSRIVTPQIRDGAIAKMGEGPWKGIYSLISILGIYVITLGFTDVKLDYDDLYDPPSFLKHIAMLLILISFIMMISGNLKTGYIKAKLKHPMLIAIKTWAFAHLLVNGDFASVILFGSLIAWAVVTLIAVKKRGGTPPVATSYIPDVISVVIGGVVFVLFALYIHSWLIGVSVIA